MTTSSSLNNEEFINFCYQTILGRKADAEGKNAYLTELNLHNLSREDLLIQFVTCEEFKERLLHGEFVPPGHFYSVIPSKTERNLHALSEDQDISNIAGIDINVSGQMKLLGNFLNSYQECPFPHQKTDGYRYYFDNTPYSYGDGITLYNMIRHFKPQRVIEIGSGFSSCVTLDTNDLFFEGSIDITFIEPYPELLHSLILDTLITEKNNKPNVIAKRLQDVDLDVFKQLKANDILFIDSTHVSKLNSDVNRIFFDILPSLPEGVIIHFHDVFWPFEYPKAWIQDGRAWNEIYMLRTFLQCNDSFEIIFFADYLAKHQREWFSENMPLFLHNPGGNIWLRKTK